MLIKSRSQDDHQAILEENFIMMKNNKVRINLTKCVFRAIVGKFLRFMLIERGIEVNLVKYIAILKMRSLTTMKKVQRLNGQIETLY